MWKVEYKPIFLKELALIPSNYRERIEDIVFTKLNCPNPYELGILQKLKGYKDKYKIRIGEYRIGLTLDNTNKTITCNRAAHRKEIYRLFP